MYRALFTTLLSVLLLAPQSLSALQVSGGTGTGTDGGSDAKSPFGRDNDSQPVRRGIQGQVMSDGVRQLSHPIEVRLETFGRTVDRAFTDGAGNFVFDRAAAAGRLFLVVQEPGFRPARIEVYSNPFITNNELVILESLDDTEDSPDDPRAVDLEQLLSDIPEEAREAFEKAAEESRDDDHERAAALLEEAIELAPDFYEAQNALGSEYQAIGRRDDAVRHLLIAKDLNPNGATPALRLGIIYLQDNDSQTAGGNLEAARASLDSAVENLETAVELDPRSEIGQYYLGAAYSKTGDSEQALDRLNRALAINEQFHDVRLVLFNVYLARREYDQALDQLSSYLEGYPESPQRNAVEQAKAQLERQMSGQ